MSPYSSEAFHVPLKKELYEPYEQPIESDEQPIENEYELRNWLAYLCDSNGCLFPRDAGLELRRSEDSCSTALEVFLGFVDVIDGPEGLVHDTSRIISRECFDSWFRSRSKAVSNPEECFRKAILAHLTCADKTSVPFPEAVEASLLQLLRRKQIWPCFSGLIKDGKNINIGCQGIRCRGFHEKKSQESGKSFISMKRKFESAGCYHTGLFAERSVRYHSM